jgi:thiol:disulfide interchange protein DsbA
MRRRFLGFLGAAAFSVFIPLAHGAEAWTEGTHFIRLQKPQRTTVPAGKVEVLEVFSYGCIACNGFQPILEKLKSGLPKNAQMAFLHASFVPQESWPMFQRAYFAAQSLGIAERTHQAIYDAVWKSNELAVVDQATHSLKNPQPTIEDAAKCYARLTGIKPEAFLAAARSFSVDAKMRAADAQVREMQVPGTPCIVINGKYRVNMDSLRSVDDLLNIVNFLVAKESATSAPKG